MRFRVTVVLSQTGAGSWRKPRKSALPQFAYYSTESSQRAFGIPSQVLPPPVYHEHLPGASANRGVRRLVKWPGFYLVTGLPSRRISGRRRFSFQLAFSCCATSMTARSCGRVAQPSSSLSQDPSRTEPTQFSQPSPGSVTPSQPDPAGGWLQTDAGDHPNPRSSPPPRHGWPRYDWQTRG